MANNKEERKTKKGIGTGTAGVIGAMIGAVVGATLATLLSNEKNRKKVMGGLGRLKDQAIGTATQMQKRSENIRKVGAKKMKEMKRGFRYNGKREESMRRPTKTT